jgi:hypothetical protein
MKNQLMRIGVYILLPGLLFLAVGGAIALREAWFKARAQAATGKFTDEGGEQVGPDRYIFTYYVTFNTPQGKKVEFVEAGLDHQLEEGKPLAILYNPSDPQDARLATRDGWDLPRRLLPVGLLFSCLGLVLTRRKPPVVPLPIGESTNVPEAPVEDRQHDAENHREEHEDPSR